MEKMKEFKEFKEIKTIEGEVKRIGKFDYYVKSDKCRHSHDEVCKNCILYGTELLELPDLDESLRVLKELNLKLNSGGLKNDI